MELDVNVVSSSCAKIHCKRKTQNVNKKYTERTALILSMIYSISVCTTAVSAQVLNNVLISSTF